MVSILRQMLVLILGLPTQKTRLQAEVRDAHFLLKHRSVQGSSPIGCPGQPLQEYTCPFQEEDFYLLSHPLYEVNFPHFISLSSQSVHKLSGVSSTSVVMSI